MLYIILADSALELIPNEIGKHTAVGKNIKRYGNAARVLDVSQHHSAMTGLKDHASRGRPDIVHHFIVDMLSSILNKWGLLRVFVHTRPTNKLYEFNPAMRPPKEYWRFKGVMFNLLRDGSLKIVGGQANTRTAFLDSDKIKPDDERQQEIIDFYDNLSPKEQSMIQDLERDAVDQFEFDLND